MTPPFTVPDPPPDDPGDVTLAVLLCRRRAWIGELPLAWRPAFVSLVPVAGSVADWWVSYEVPDAGETMASPDPIAASAVAHTLRWIGFDPDSATWLPDPRFGGEQPGNPHLRCAGASDTQQ